MITVQNLTKRYGSTVAVKNISFTVQKGEVLGFLGPNGAGKSTTMRIITCYMPPDTGTVKIGDLDIFSDSLKIREKIGYLPENAPLYHDMGVIDYLDFIAHIRGISYRERQERIKKMITLCGLEKVIGKDIGHLSKGYRQRVGLAQTLIHDPDILILDEPTSGLDPSQIKEIRELIKSIGEEKTVILCTHILQEVSMTCKRVIIINEGEITASGTPEELSVQAGGGDTVQLGIHGVKDDIVTTLKELDFVKEVNVLETDASGYHRMLLNVEKNTRANEKLFDVAVSRSWKLNELTRTEKSLEDVFLKLTEGEK